jgi:6-phosphogluconolactonase
MESVIKIFNSPDEVAESLAADLVNLINSKIAAKGFFSIAISGGNTPGLLFLKLAEIEGGSINWVKVHFFWADERCVPPDDRDSNFGMARKTLLDTIKIPVCNVHRMRGEDEPHREILRYSDELTEFLQEKDGMPYFNAILLGLGEDGHTASIFPGHEDLFTSDDLCVKTIHPGTGQDRITITGKLINNSENLIFMVTGKNKSGIIKEILEPVDKELRYPASFVRPIKGSLSWYIDSSAAGLLAGGSNSLSSNL